MTLTAKFSFGRNTVVLSAAAVLLVVVLVLISFPLGAVPG